MSETREVLCLHVGLVRYLTRQNRAKTRAAAPMMAIGWIWRRAEKEFRVMKIGVEADSFFCFESGKPSEKVCVDFGLSAKIPRVDIRFS